MRPPSQHKPHTAKQSMTPSLQNTLFGDKVRQANSSNVSIQESAAPFFRQRASSQLKTSDKVLLRADDINRNMAAREVLLRESGFTAGARKQANQSALQRHKQPSSIMNHYDDASTAINSY